MGTTSFLSRVREGWSRLTAGSRLHRGGLVRAARDEAPVQAAAVLREGGSADPVEFLRRMITPIATSFSAGWTISRAITVRAKALAGASRALIAARLRYITAVVAATRLLADPKWRALVAAYAQVVDVAYGVRASYRDFNVPAWVNRLVMLAVAVCDFSFFLLVFMDVFDASPSQADYVVKLIMSIAFALSTPLLVFTLSEFGGPRLARMRAEIRDVFDEREDARLAGEEPAVMTADQKRSIFLTPAIVVGGFALIATLFFAFGLHRFGSAASGPGANAAADPFLLALFVVILPTLALVASVLHHNPSAARHARVMRDWDGFQLKVTAAVSELGEAMQAWRFAYLTLRELIGEILAEGQVSLQNWQQLMLLGVARASRVGEISVDMDGLLATMEVGSSPLARPTTVVVTPDDEPETEAAPEPVPETVDEFSGIVDTTQLPTVFRAAPWVLDALVSSLDTLRIYRPRTDGPTADEVSRQLGHAHPVVSVFADADGDASAPAGPDVSAIAQLEAMLGERSTS